MTKACISLICRLFAFKIVSILSAIHHLLVRNLVRPERVKSGRTRNDAVY
jgi:hypothetical protein